MSATNSNVMPISATTIKEHEMQQVDRANKTGLQPVVFVHGLWLLPSSWEPLGGSIRECRLHRSHTWLTAINDNGLPSAESFLHQEQIGLRDLGSFADSANRETVAHALV